MQLWEAIDPATDDVRYITRAFSREDAKNRVNAALNVTGGYGLARAVCRYSTAHQLAGKRATRLISAGPVGKVPACDDCAKFYEQH